MQRTADLSIKLHSIISQKAIILIFTNVRTSNPSLGGTAYLLDLDVAGRIFI
jgi:hypothetical protein